MDPFGCYCCARPPDTAPSAEPTLPTEPQQLETTDVETLRPEDFPQAGVEEEKPIQKDSEPEPEQVLAPKVIEEEEVAIFDCQLTRSAEQEWGFVYDVWPKVIQITGIKAGGCIEAYNESATQARQIGSPDFLLAIDGEAVNLSTIDKLKAARSVRLKVVRPSKVVVSLARRNKGPWGFNVAYQETTSSCLRITTLTDGVATTYNESASAENRICINDFIETTNGVSKKAVNMLKELRGADAATLTLLRLPDASE